MEPIDIVIYLSIYLGLVATAFYILSYFSHRKKGELLFSDEELPFVSVLIPAWNEEGTIQKTIESIMASDYKDFEVIVIDDGSKDDTLQIAKSLEKKYKRLKVFHKENGGKATALNFGIEKAKGNFIFTMDADTHVNSDSMKKMVRYFKEPNVMCVSPGMLVYNPRTILQRVQQMEYLLGLFLRKAFASLNSVFVTPGAFSAYRKSFFEKYGNYDVGNITEDLELALRIQFYGYRIENCPSAAAWTVVPGTFSKTISQRRRWYNGWIKNLWKYRKMFGKKYGDMGSFVMPIAGLNIVFSITVMIYMFFRVLGNIKDELLFLNSVNFNLTGWSINLYVIERFLFLFFTNPIIIFIFIFMFMLWIYVRYATQKVGKSPGIFLNFILFFMFFSVLFGFWWIMSIIYGILHRKVKWR